jgi:hypothetical protein
MRDFTAVGGLPGGAPPYRRDDLPSLVGIITLLLLEVFVFGTITGLLAALPLFGRVLVTAVLLFPLGFFMGMPFPKAVLRVGLGLRGQRSGICIRGYCGASGSVQFRFQRCTDRVGRGLPVRVLVADTAGSVVCVPVSVANGTRGHEISVATLE